MLLLARLIDLEDKLFEDLFVLVFWLFGVDPLQELLGCGVAFGEAVDLGKAGWEARLAPDKDLLCLVQPLPHHVCRCR